MRAERLVPTTSPLSTSSAGMMVARSSAFLFFSLGLAGPKIGNGSVSLGRTELREFCAVLSASVKGADSLGGAIRELRSDGISGCCLGSCIELVASQS